MAQHKMETSHPDPEEQTVASLAASIEAEVQDELSVLMQELTQRATDICKELCAKRFAQALEEQRCGRVRAAASRGAELKVEEAARASAAILVSAAAVSGGVRKEETVLQVTSAIAPSVKEEAKMKSLSELQDLMVGTPWAVKGGKAKEGQAVGESMGKGKPTPLSNWNVMAKMAGASRALLNGEAEEDESYRTMYIQKNQINGKGKGKGESRPMVRSAPPAAANGISNFKKNRGYPRGFGEVSPLETGKGYPQNKGMSWVPNGEQDENVGGYEPYGGFKMQPLHETDGAGLGMGASFEMDAKESDESWSNSSDIHLMPTMQYEQTVSRGVPMKGKSTIPKGKGKGKNEQGTVFSAFTSLFG